VSWKIFRQRFHLLGLKCCWLYCVRRGTFDKRIKKQSLSCCKIKEQKKFFFGWQFEEAYRKVVKILFSLVKRIHVRKSFYLPIMEFQIQLINFHALINRQQCQRNGKFFISKKSSCDCHQSNLVCRIFIYNLMTLFGLKIN